MTLDDPPHSGRLQMGGTLRDDRLYIERPEDEHVYELLVAGKPCHVSGPRQMGKSSLLARLQGRLLRAGVRVLHVDLSSIAPTRSERDDWFRALLSSMSLELDGSLTRFDRWWQERHSGEAMVARFLAFAEEFFLGAPSPIVVVLDEIETTLSATFTDELFIAIRALFQGRGARPDLQRVTFCLAGNVEANSLIKEPREAPFEIVTTVRLTDFSRSISDLAPLDTYLDDRALPGKALVDEVLWWTAGQPFLTMALAYRVAATQSHDVDGLVRNELERSRLFSVHLAQLGSTLERHVANDAATLRAYADIVRNRRGARLPQSAEDELVRVGLLRREGDSVQLRNRIYALCFGDAWLDVKEPSGVLQKFTRSLVGVRRILNRG